MRVPTYDQPQVQATGLQPSMQSPDAHPDFASKQLSDMGAAVGNAGGALLQVQLDAVNLANQVRIDSGLNELERSRQKYMYDQKDGYLAKQGQFALDPDGDGLALPDSYEKKLREDSDRIMATFANDAQRTAFAQRSANVLTQFRGQVQGHMLQEGVKHSLSVQDGTMEVAMQRATRGWNNPTEIDEGIKSLTTAIFQKDLLQGEVGDLTKAKQVEAVSKVHAANFDSAITSGNTKAAMAYLDAYGKDMSPKDLIKARSLITAQVEDETAYKAADQGVSASFGAFSPSDDRRVIEITGQAESLNRDYDDNGKPVISPAGAKYRMQVMPVTAKNPGYGIRPAKDDSPEEYNRVGEELIAKLIVLNKGDMEKAWAAYNAGQGTVDKAIKAGGDNWLTAMSQFQSPANHKQTTEYVAKNVAALNIHRNAPIDQPSEAKAVKQALSLLPQGASVSLIEKTTSKAKAAYQLQAQERKTESDNIVFLAQNLMAQKKLTYDALPLKVRSQVAQFAPDKVDSMINFGKTITTPVEVKTNMSLYAMLSQDPIALAKISDPDFMQFKTQLSDSDFKKFADLRQEAKGGRVSNPAEKLNQGVINQQLGYLLPQIGIKADPPSSDTAAWARIGSIQQYLGDSILDAQKRAGKPMTDDELIKHIDQQFAKNITFRNTLFGIETGGKESTPLLKMTIKDIPSDKQAAIKASLVKAGIASPTENQIVRTYWKMYAKK